jgi:NADPH:quinone reductase-like Zn-dependent oxidoreductase
VQEPDPDRGEAVVEVRAISVNRGELHRLRAGEAGWRPGWDLAGIVRSAVAGSPPTGARVVGMVTGGAWAEKVAVPGDWLAELPTEVSFAQAAALPVAGLTALRTLRLGPAILGRRVLIVGAAGGVGRFAIQLARLGGAEVTAIAGSPERAEGLRDLGATEVVTGIAELRGRYDLILESAGGDSLARLATMVHPDGTLVMFGNSSRQDTTFNVTPTRSPAEANEPKASGRALTENSSIHAPGVEQRVESGHTMESDLTKHRNSRKSATSRAV